MIRLLKQLPSRPELAMVLVLVGIIAVLIVPLSTLMLDILTVISMASCLLVLLIAVRVRTPVELLTFPALLLITTMLRLSLNVASTKMILLDGRAGHVVETFGRVFVGNNLLVGICVFAIVSLVQFLVVAKGADRVAEVAARFSLDAMPGKQMSIDAEMRGGSLTADQASARREQLDIESRFFGGMDGAMKFVKGDAIAGLIITVINILGGIASGMMYHGMTASAALQRYATLSIGDAMVAQIPSFMLAVAAGLVTTRVTASRGVRLDLAQQIGSEIRRHPSSLAYTGICSLLLGLIPGFPIGIFGVLGVALIGSSVLIQRQSRQLPTPAPPRLSRPMLSFRVSSADAPPPFIAPGQAHFDAPLVLTLPRRLAERLDLALLDEAMAATRARLSDHWGAPYPGLRCRLAEDSEGNAGDAMPLRWSMNASHDVTILWRDAQPLRLGAATPHDDGPLGLPGFPDAYWDDSGEPGVTPEELIARVTEHLCIRERSRLLTHEQFAELAAALRQAHPQLMEAVAANVPLPVMVEVVRGLLREGISLRWLPQVCDMMLTFAPLPPDGNTIADMLTTGWSRRRCADAAENGVVKVHLVDPSLELMLQAYANANSSKPQEGPLPRLDMDVFREARQLFSELAVKYPRGFINLACRGGGRLLVSEIAAMAGCRFRVFSMRGINPRFDVQVLSVVMPSESLKRRMEELGALAYDAGGGDDTFDSAEDDHGHFDAISPSNVAYEEAREGGWQGTH